MRAVDTYLRNPGSQGLAYAFNYDYSDATGYLDSDRAYSAYVRDHTAPGQYVNYVFNITASPDASGLTKTGTDTLTLAGANTYTGTTTVAGGTLIVDGSLASATSVLSGARLGGAGSVGATTIADGGILVGVQGRTLTLASLALLSGSIVDATFGAADGTALLAVVGDLTLDGTVNVASIGGFGSGVYRLATYGGRLTDHGLMIGTAPTEAQRIAVQTSVAGQVNIVSQSGDLLFWDGGDATRHNNGRVDGGAGIWSATAPNWTDADARINDALSPRPGFAVFAGDPGTVTVDRGAGAIAVTGIQFATNGYTLTGDAIDLAAPVTVLRVGDGTVAGSAATATIAAPLTGANALTKTDLGALILAGANSYSGATTIDAGPLTLAGGQAIADANAVLVNANGTLTLRNSEWIGSLTGSGAVALGGNTLLLRHERSTIVVFRA